MDKIGVRKSAQVGRALQRTCQRGGIGSNRDVVIQLHDDEAPVVQLFHFALWPLREGGIRLQ